MTTDSPRIDNDILSDEQMARFKELNDKLATLGNPFEHVHSHACGESCDHEHAPTQDYVAQFQLTGEDVPHLLSIAQDWIDQEFPPDFPAWVFAPVHAWRALGQLRDAGSAKDTIDALLEMYTELLADEDEAGSELPFVIKDFGDAAWEPLLKAAAELGPELPLLDAVYQLAKDNKERQAQFVEVLGQLMDEQDDNEPQGNAALAILLGELDTDKTHSLAVERAYAADVVDETIAGDWGTLRTTYDLPATGLAQDGRRVKWWRDAMGGSLYERQLNRQRQLLNERDRAKEEKAKAQVKPKQYKKRK